MRGQWLCGECGKWVSDEHVDHVHLHFTPNPIEWQINPAKLPQEAGMLTFTVYRRKLDDPWRPPDAA